MPGLEEQSGADGPSGVVLRVWEKDDQAGGSQSEM